jgi:hypothetical protein
MLGLPCAPTEAQGKSKMAQNEGKGQKNAYTTL